MRQPSPEAAERLVAHFRNDTTDLADEALHVPRANFTSAERAAAERDLMRRLPLIVAHRSDLPDPGDFVTRDVLGAPILIVRDSDGSVGAYRNMCRHRGGCVEAQKSGSKRVFVCAYHGWAYDRDGGGLRNVPFEETYGPIDHEANGLVKIHCEERHGFVWVDFSNDTSRRVADYLGPEVDARLDDLGLDGSVVFMDNTVELDVNWKLVMDGAYDVLHPKFLHPTGVGKLFQTNLAAWFDYGRHGQLFTARKRLEAVAKSGEPVEAAWRYIATNLVLYPNSMVIAAPDHIEFWTVWPSTEEAGKSTTNIRFLIRPELLTDEMAERLNQSWEILSHAGYTEDWPMERAIQVNAEADPSGDFLYGRSEISCQHLHRQLSRDLDATP